VDVGLDQRSPSDGRVGVGVGLSVGGDEGAGVGGDTGNLGGGYIGFGVHLAEHSSETSSFSQG
jgi:hypothetical protein